MRTIDPSIFAFAEQSIDIAGMAQSGGQSLSGLDDPIESDGGGFVTAAFSSGTLVDREANLAWRAVTTGLRNGALPAVVLFADRRHQPVGARPRRTDLATAPLPDLPLRPSDEAQATLVQLMNGSPGGLRCTRARLEVNLTMPLLGGEWFTIVHPTWGPRAYNISQATPDGDDRYIVDFSPPLREATAIGTAVDFEEPRCKMRLAGATSNQIAMKRTGSAAMQFVEDMRPPR